MDDNCILKLVLADDRHCWARYYNHIDKASSIIWLADRHHSQVLGIPEANALLDKVLSGDIAIPKAETASVSILTEDRRIIREETICTGRP